MSEEQIYEQLMEMLEMSLGSPRKAIATVASDTYRRMGNILNSNLPLERRNDEIRYAMAALDLIQAMAEDKVRPLVTLEEDAGYAPEG